MTTTEPLERTRDDTARWTGRLWWIAALVVVSPLWATAIILSQRSWFPVLDMAMTEFRVRDVGTSDSPLIGLPGRIGEFPDQGSHPGPWSFYLLAPTYRLAGSSAFGLQLGSIVVNTVAVVATMWIVGRRRRPLLTLAVAAVIALAIRGYGVDLLTMPWNPYFPLLPWLLVLVATWAVLEGDRWMALVVVGVGSVAAQTHIPYLLLAISMCAMVMVALAVRWARGSSADRSAFLGALGLGAVIWLPPFVDQLINDPGNIRRLIEHFTGTTDEEPIGIWTGTELFLQHLDLLGALRRLATQNDALVGSVDSGAAQVAGLVTFLAWIACFAISVRLRHRSLVHLHAVVAVALGVGWFSMIRIFGLTWFYLTLWAWATALLLGLSIAWTVTAWWRAERGPVTPRARQWLGGGIVVVGGLATIGTIVSASDHRVPEQRIGEAVGELIEPTMDAIEDGAGAAVGTDGTYLVFWQDAAHIGSPGYGLLNELERRGVDVGVHPPWQATAGEHRVLRAGDVDAEVHLVTGGFIEDWRLRPDHVEVASVDFRTAEERARAAELEAFAETRLRDEGRDDLAEMVGTNLFGVLLVQDLPRDVLLALVELDALTVPMSVFIAPPGSSP